MDRRVAGGRKENSQTEVEMIREDCFGSFLR